MSSSIETEVGPFQVHSIAMKKFSAGIGTQVAISPTRFCAGILPLHLKRHQQDCPSWQDSSQIGQYVNLTPMGLDELQKTFLCGMGIRTDNPADYFPAVWRGRVELFGHRRLACPVVGAAAIIYTRDAFLNDPETSDTDRQWLLPYTKYILVDVLAHDGSAHAPMTPERFVANMAGANRDQLNMSGDNLRAMAKDVAAYWWSRIVVGDPPT